MADRLTESDVGKRVVTENDEEIGMITDVADDAAAVDPAPDLTERLKTKLGRESAETEDETHRIQEESVSAISDDRVVRLADRDQ